MHPFKNVRLRAALLGLLLILATAAAAQAQSRARDLGFRFDPTRSQQFLWPQETTQTKSVVTAQSKTEVLVDWPELAPGTNTLFFELQVDVPTRARRGVEPAVTMRRGEITRVQYFEPGAEGRRFLNLSDLIPAEGQSLKLTATGMSLVEQVPPGHFVSFINRDLEPLRTLVIAPHPDDAEIATFGVYATTDADVVTVTSGDAGGQNFESLYPEPGDHYRIKGWIRTWDSITVPFFGGVPPERARNLGYYDATLKELYDQRPAAVATPLATLGDPGFYRTLNVNKRLAETPFVATWPGLVDSLAKEVKSTKPDVILATHPWLDAHWDHQYASIALFEALASLQKTGEASAKNCELYLYTNHMVDAEIYPFGPRDGVQSLPPWFEQPLPFERIHSVPVDEETRRRKLIALEAMHDLRPFRVGGQEREAKRRKTRRQRPDYSYYRRAPRPNELFFVVPCSQAAELAKSFTANRPPES